MKTGTLFISILVSVGLVFSISGCCVMKQEATSTPVAQEQTVVLEEIESKEVIALESETIDANSALTLNHIVKRDECLWWIAEYEDVYNDPFMWPLIYNANEDKFKNPDLIYPGQTLRIPRSGYTMDDILEARRMAGAQRPYTPPAESLPPIE